MSDWYKLESEDVILSGSDVIGYENALYKSVSFAAVTPKCIAISTGQKPSKIKLR